MFRMLIDDKVPVGAQRVEARSKSQRLSRDIGEILGKELLDAERFTRIGVAIDPQRIRDRDAARMFGGFQTLVVDAGKAIKAASIGLVQKSRKAVRGRVEPLGC